MTFLYILTFLVSCGMLFWLGEWLIEVLERISRFLKWREFVVAFIVIALGASIPNLFVGITSAFHKIPELSFGDIVGGNIINLTLAVALAVFVAKKLPAQSRTTQTTSIFTIIIAILPLFLILDGILGRGDGIILILVFCLYFFWLFSKKERFTRIFDKSELPLSKEFKIFIKDLGEVILGIALLLLAAKGIVKSAVFFADALNFPLALIGILIVGLGDTLPETYFSVLAARKGQTWMILGNLMGSVVITATLVLGIVALIYPIEISDFSPFAIARIFLIISALFFLFSIKTGHKITRKEGLFLLGIYIAFILIQILNQKF